ncbi:ABC-2 transporter permease [Streptomyces gibsoniae]|uniref:ABC transporter permease n=1 Tax=Streptomyces gibsoniae TaxID=3075529 RepID=A0ABU2TW33_9ACTN|nr:hypothetical protein [Streptomyces sp. DSM 41699]MDT0465182.1 hypothetical protein [Streptomyces sp. DSM 41699]
MHHKRAGRHALGHLIIPHPTVRAVTVHLLTPVLMCLGMGLAYIGAFHAPQDHAHGLKVAVVGDSARDRLLAQAIKDKAGDTVDVTTLPDRAAARHQIMHRDLVGAYVPSAKHPELIVADANSSSSATAAQDLFTTVAAQQGDPLKVTDLSRLASGDPGNQGLFYVMIALSIGANISAITICTAGATLAVWLRAALGVGTALVVSVIGAVLAGPVFHIVDHDLWGVWGMAWLYTTGILLIGIGLHTFLKRFTMLALMALFIMLNFTSSGGIFEPELQSGFFGALHAFWNGAGFVEGARSLLYFPSAALGGRLLSLVLWLVAGLLLLPAAAAVERRGAPAPAHLPAPDTSAEEEMSGALAV